MTAFGHGPSPPTRLPEGKGRFGPLSLRQRGRGEGGGRGRGFTLVELLVAIWIMAVVAIIAWRGLSSLIATRDRLTPETDEVRALLTGFGQMERDLAQAANPVLISLIGSPVRVRIIEGATALQILRFSQPQPDGASAVQQVTYSVIDGALLRQSSPPMRSIQAVLNAAPTTVQLVAGVASMQVRVWRLNEGWVVPAEGDTATPAGVEVQITRSDGTRLRRVLLVG
jgi:general secretion pathway protein J